ncbi:MAG: type II CRISPR RNA-guided endonuclease Cas9 [Phycisphaerae bacterium]|nr:type II CRISPR RNA-guided endonuclease Cas9 [Phycisphaerae bacterium]HAI13476.1 type II CRISPR RNA-guided endonuclease Cas9 [Phycisphaerales bacterium]|tara:strand:+ start:3352 stop:6666 length:3315 start_codon:yes stop_codon:yes gene_type:complete
MATTLGLDLGPNSIGWALLDETHILGTGVRIFPEGMDKFDTGRDESRNEQRQIARGMRRQTKRRNQRKRLLREALIQAKLWPTDPKTQNELYELDPYELRSKAASEKVSAFELGRICLHLGQRRGFLSNRKKDREDSEVKGMLAEINKLEADIEKASCKTLGQLLYLKCINFDHAKRVEEDHIRNRHTQRSMLATEFEVIWEEQAKHHPALLTKTLRYGVSGEPAKYPIKPRHKAKGQTLLEAFGVHGMIFFQRPMYWPASMVGLCELEPKQKRCPRSHRMAQRFRLLTEINNLQLTDNTQSPPTPRRLTDSERAYVLDQLQTKKDATFIQIANWIAKLPDSPPAESIQFNLQKGKRAGMKGMVTDAMLASKKVLGESWHKRDEEQKTAIVELLLSIEHDEEQTVTILVEQYDFTTEQANAAVSVNFPDGYLHLSKLALSILLPHMEKGLVYQALDESNSALNAAGYLRRDQLKKRLFDKLPRQDAFNCPLGDIPNPVVKRTLTELRRVVNCIIKEYNMPDDIHLEMARSVSMGTQARKEFSKVRSEREKMRNDAANEIRKLGFKVSREAINRYLIWDQQNHECMYTGNKISQTQLFNGEVDVDHILPRSRSLDDSQSNKVVCFRSANADKGQRTVYEWLAASDPKRFDEISTRALAFVKNHGFPYGKFKKLIQKNVDVDSFIARQLTDTGYIAKATRQYLACLFEDDKHILGLKGQHTATLRHQWGLNNILRHDDINQKSRDDHRHHAIDAILVAVTNRSRLQQLSKGYQEVEQIDYTTGEVQYRQAHKGPALDEPWENFRSDVESAVNEINVSHRVNRKISGQLHKDNPFAPVKDREGKTIANTYVKRKLVETLTTTEIEAIRDETIRTIVKNALKVSGLDIDSPKKPDKKKMQEVLSQVTMPSGVPIKKVRVLTKDQTIQPIRTKRSEKANDPTQIAYVKPGSTHHLCIFEWEEKGKTKRDAIFTSRIQAMDILKQQQQFVTEKVSQLDQKPKSASAKKVIHSQFYKQASEKFPLIERQHPTRKHAKFVMSLSNGEAVLANWKGQQKLLVLRTSISTNKNVIFIEHTDARREYSKHKTSTNLLSARKVTVDPLGRIRWAND